VSLDSIVDRFGLGGIDVLQIDTEGFDAEIVRMALKCKMLPDCIYFEYIHVKGEMRKLVDEVGRLGYRITYDKWNALLISERLINSWAQ
jgi:hypothetical protein